MKILVTAVAGDLGQSIVKTLRWGTVASKVIGADLNANGIGANFVDAFYPLPPANKKAEYLQALNRLCRTNQVSVIIPASEIEIRLLSRTFSSLQLACGTKIIAQPFKWISVYGDKLKCMKKLSKRIELPCFADGSIKKDVEAVIRKVGFPVVVKPRLLSGSRSIGVARNSRELEVLLSQTSQPLVQEYLDDSGGEFSVGAFASQEGKKLICFRRHLGPVGCSWYAELDQDKEVLAYSEKLLAVTHLRGASNFQVRKTRRGVRLLEINPRFSSLVVARAVSGFKDVEWAILDSLRRPIVFSDKPYKRLRFQRFFHEMVDLGKGYHVPYTFNRKGALALR